MSDKSPTPFLMKNWLAPSKIRFFIKARDKEKIKAEGETALGRVVTFPLENKFIRDILSRTFEPGSRDSYLVSVRAPTEFSKRLTTSIFKEDDILGAEKAISDHERMLNEFLDLNTAQATQRLIAAGQNPDSFNRVLSYYEAKIITSTMSGFLSIYQKADYLYTLYNALWLFGELANTTDESNRAWRLFEKNLKKQLFAYSAIITKNAGKVQSLLFRLQQERQSWRNAADKGENAAELGLSPEGHAAHDDRRALRQQLPEIIRELREAVGAEEPAPGLHAVEDGSPESGEETEAAPAKTAKKPAAKKPKKASADAEASQSDMDTEPLAEAA